MGFTGGFSYDLSSLRADWRSLVQLTCHPLPSKTSKDTWAGKKPLPDQGPVSLFCGCDSCCPESTICFSSISSISWDVLCLVHADRPRHTFHLLRNLSVRTLLPNLYSQTWYNLQTSFLTPAFLPLFDRVNPFQHFPLLIFFFFFKLRSYLYTPRCQSMFY